MRQRLTLTAVLLGISLPAQASTLPKVDFKAGEHILTVGLLDANYDYAVSDHFSFGVSTTAVVVDLAARATVRAVTLGPVSVGATLGAGLSPNLWGPTPLSAMPEPVSFWVQPALNLTFGAPDDVVKLRTLIGPKFMNGRLRLPQNPLEWALQSAELAFRLNEQHEITVGGNGLVGWRGTF